MGGVSAQLVQAGYALALGAGAGLFYDALRVLRSRIRLRAVTLLCDFIFCAAAGLALFALGLTVGGGRGRIVLCVIAVCGMAMYFLVLSRAALVIFRKIADGVTAALRLLVSPVVFLWQMIKKFTRFSKKLFIYRRKWYIFEERSAMRRSYRNSKESVYHAQTHEYTYESGAYRRGAVPDLPDNRHKRKVSKSKGGA
ncbi:MAG: hypothetical protein LBC78_05460 [Oscillospiraceae bacterium]|jgi:hypothetical protein|nr:hypothetical protein [Oscillospiraceae bacterium]